MCGRYTLHSDVGEIVLQLDLDGFLPWTPRYNIAPGQEVPVVGQDSDGRRRVRAFRWGLVPGWARDPKIANRLINARSETAAEKPAFRQAFRHRRCLLVADGFYEWRQTEAGKVPCYVRRCGGGVFAFAGLWERWLDAAGGELRTCTLLTKDATGTLADIHARMPVVLDGTVHAAWLDRGLTDADRIRELAQGLDGASFEVSVVGRAVNDVRQDGPELIVPVSPG